MRRGSGTWIVVMVAWALAWPALAAAQYAPRQGFRLDRMLAGPTPQDGFAVTLPATLTHLEWSAQLIANYAFRPLVLRTPQEHDVVAHRLAAELDAALGLWDRLEVYARLPVVLVSAGHGATLEQTRFSPPSGAALSDLALGATGEALHYQGFGLGARAELLLPTGDRGQLASDEALAPRAQLLASYEMTKLLFALNVGWVYRPERDYALSRIGSELEWAAAVRCLARAQLAVSLEAFGTRGLRARDSAGAVDTLDVLLGGRQQAPTGRVILHMGAAIGAGFSEAAGEPKLRALFTLGVGPRPVAASREPSPHDRDGDWIADATDECPDEGEDLDGHEDQDGCRDEDDDGDGVADALDRCPRRAGSEQGCPPADTDRDDIPDARDQCPRDAEDFDGDRDQDGCPDRDSDGDGLTDDADACPDVKGPLREHGCLAHARLGRERITLLHPIQFVARGASLSAAAAPVLDDVGALLAARPPIRARIEVRAHADGREAATALAQRRAESVLQALVQRGIAPARLTAAGRPAADGGHEGVELIVSVPARAPAPPTPAAGDRASPP